MTNRWLLPDHIADVLPVQARRIEETRRALLDEANRYGFELVMPPLVEHLNSLLIGVGSTAGGTLDLQTFKLVDQQSGRSLGVRADTTPQVARIDAHLLNRQGITRLCYCGPVLHTRQATPHASREPLQFGAEIYGHSGLEADLEVMELAINSFAIGRIQDVVLDLSDVRIVRALLAAYPVDGQLEAIIYLALATKDAPAIEELDGLNDLLRSSLLTLLGLYGDAAILDAAHQTLPALEGINLVLKNLAWLKAQLIARGVDAKRIRFDLADVGGYGYYTGIRFAVYSANSKDALARGGRYDNLGVAFGRQRAAVGFSLDIKTLVDAVPAPSKKASIRMPWNSDPALGLAARALRLKGETVICVLPNHADESDEFVCDRALVQVDNQWVVKTL